MLGNEKIYNVEKKSLLNYFKLLTSKLPSTVKEKKNNEIKKTQNFNLSAVDFFLDLGFKFFFIYSSPIYEIVCECIFYQTLSLRTV